MMSSPYLPTELLDYIVDHLHDTEDALKSCGLLSKSWIPRTRRHLFTNILFGSRDRLQSWKTMFPDPSSSPASYAKYFFIRFPQFVTATDAEGGGWISTFSNVVHFEVDIGLTWGNRPARNPTRSILQIFARYQDSPHVDFRRPVPAGFRPHSFIPSSRRPLFEPFQFR